MSEKACNHEAMLVLAAHVLKQTIGQIQHDSLNPKMEPMHQAGLATAAYAIEAAYAGVASALIIHKTVGHGESVEQGFTPDQWSIGLVQVVEKAIDDYFGIVHEHNHDHDPGDDDLPPPATGGQLN